VAPQPPQRQRDSKRRRNALAPSPQALPRRREHTECRPNKGWLIRPATLFYGAGRRPAVGLWHLLGNHYPAIWSATTLQLAAAWRPRTVADEIRMIRPARWWKQDGGNHGDRDRRDVNHLGTPAGWTSPVHAWCRDKPVCCFKAKVLEILFLSGRATAPRAACTRTPHLSDICYREHTLRESERDRSRVCVCFPLTTRSGGA